MKKETLLISDLDNEMTLLLESAIFISQLSNRAMGKLFTDSTRNEKIIEFLKIMNGIKDMCNLQIDIYEKMRRKKND